MMDRSEFFEYIEKNYGIKGDHPFEKYPDVTVFRHQNNKKWFAAVMEVRKRSLGIPDDGYIDVVNLKCEYILIHSLIHDRGIYPAYHMNKAHWISVALSECDREQLYGLVDISYELTKNKSKKSPQ